MRFDYTAILSVVPDTGDAVVIFRPELRIRVHGPSGSADFLAPVDTGADNTILVRQPLFVARGGRQDLRRHNQPLGRAATFLDVPDALAPLRSASKCRPTCSASFTGTALPI